MEKKEKQAVYYFLGWLIVGFCIIFVGVNNVFALEFEKPNYINFYDNTGTTLTSLGATCDEVRCISNETATLVANSTGAVVAFQLDTQLIKGYNYSITIFVDIKDSNDDDGISLSSKNYIGVGSNVTNARNNYINKTGVTINTSYAGRNHVYYNFTVTSSTASQYIVIPFTTKQTVQNAYIRFWGSELISNGSGLTENQIDTITNNQTNILNNSIQNSTDTITGEIDDMEQSIIDNQNSNTDKEIESQKICDFIDKSNIKENGKFLNSSGVLTNYAESGVTDYININGAEVITLTNVSSVNGVHLCYYTVNKELISCVNSDTTINDPLNLPQNTYYMRATILTTYNRPTYQICKNGNQGLNDQLGNLNDSLNDSNVDGSLNNAGSFFDSFQSPDHGGLSGIITAPLVAINEMLNTTCNPMTATFKGKEISLPCGYEFWNKMGAIRDFLNVVLGGMLCYNIVKKLFKLIERIKNPEDDRVEVMDL